MVIYRWTVGRRNLDTKGKGRMVVGKAGSTGRRRAENMVSTAFNSAAGAVGCNVEPLTAPAAVLEALMVSVPV